MKYDVAIKGWLTVDAETEAEANAKEQEAIEWLTEGANRRSYAGVKFEETGLHPLADPPAVKSE